MFIVLVVLGLGEVHLMQVAHHLDWEEDELAIGIVVGGRKRVVLAKGISLQFEILVHHLLPFSAL